MFITVASHCHVYLMVFAQEQHVSSSQLVLPYHEAAFLAPSPPELLMCVARRRSEEKGPNVQTASTATKYNATQPDWHEKFHLCVFESNQVLKLVISHNMEYSAFPLSFAHC